MFLTRLYQLVLSYYQWNFFCSVLFVNSTSWSFMWNLWIITLICNEYTMTITNSLKHYFCKESPYEKSFIRHCKTFTEQALIDLLVVYRHWKCRNFLVPCWCLSYMECISNWCTKTFSFFKLMYQNFQIFFKLMYQNLKLIWTLQTNLFFSKLMETFGKIDKI